MRYLNKPKTYKHQATVETVNAGIPYYVASLDYGYEGVHVPIAGTVSELSRVNEQTGKLIPNNVQLSSTSLWVTCTASRYQGDVPYHRCSLRDDGVVHQTYNPRMAFLNPFAAKYYAETGKLSEE